MKLTALVLLLAGCALAEQRFRSRDIVNYINNLGTTWKAGTSHRFEGMQKSQIRGMMGVLMDEERRLHELLPEHDNAHISNDDIPDTFDARTAWPNCADVISNIRDQSACGSCWAVAAAGAMSDRICIASQGKTKISISAEDLMSCCMSCGFGCGGGYLAQAWSYFKSTGLVTGGEYGDKNSCQPYPFPMCEHHNNHTGHPPCPAKEYDTPKCAKTCQTGYPVAFDDDKHHAKSTYGVRTVASIQKEIMTYGPVEASYTVYDDFLAYTTGVYSHKTGGYDGGHAVRMIGWGTEDGTPYWLIANSWNSDWGDKGYFKIKRGTNECGIEGGITAGQV